MAASGIYEIRNRASGKRYIGSAVDIAARWRLHKHSLAAGTHHCKYLQRAWDKRGPEAFEFAVLEVCDRGDLIVREQAAIDDLNPEYNSSRVAGSVLGLKHSAEARAKMASAKRGSKISDEHRANIGRSSAAMWAEKRLRVEPKRKQSVARSQEHCDRLAEIKREFWARRKADGLPGFQHGKVRTDEQRARYRDAAKAAWDRRKALAIP